MINLLDNIGMNQEWLFYGVGGTILILFVGFVRRRFLRRPGITVVNPEMFRTSAQKTAGASKSDEEDLSGKVGALAPLVAAPTFGEISAALEKVAPRQLAGTAKKYWGMPVRWETRLASTMEMMDVIFVSLDLTDGSGSVSVKVNLADYPDLPTLPRGSPVVVLGQIESVLVRRVHLHGAVLHYRGSLQ